MSIFFFSFLEVNRNLNGIISRYLSSNLLSVITKYCTFRSNWNLHLDSRCLHFLFHIGYSPPSLSHWLFFFAFLPICDFFSASIEYNSGTQAACYCGLYTPVPRKTVFTERRTQSCFHICTVRIAAMIFMNIRIFLFIPEMLLDWSLTKNCSISLKLNFDWKQRFSRFRCM